MEARFPNINRVIKQLDEGYVLNVGIMGSKATKIHGGSKSTNAEIGAIHEFGSISRNIPARSFLRMPLQTKIPQLIRSKSTSFIKFLLNGHFLQWLQMFGVEAENIVQEAFETSGFGTWKKLKPSTIKHRRKSLIEGEQALPLIDTGELRRSITSEVRRD